MGYKGIPGQTDHWEMKIGGQCLAEGKKLQDAFKTKSRNNHLETEKDTSLSMKIFRKPTDRKAFGEGKDNSSPTSRLQQIRRKTRSFRQRGWQ